MNRLSAKSGLGVALGILALGWLVFGAGLALEARRGGPEPALRAYLSDLEAHQVDGALAALTPEAAARWRDFVDFQQFNRYRVVSVAVRTPSLLESWKDGRAWLPTQATLVADITEPSGTTWRGSTIVPVTLVGGRWLIERPPFAGDE